MSTVPDEAASDKLLSLLPQHLEDLRASGLSDEQIRRCRFHSSSDPVHVAKLLGWKNQATREGGAA